MDPILELLNLLGGLLLLSAILGVFVSVLSADADISTHMLPTDIENHVFSRWKLSSVAGVSVLSDGTLKLDGIELSGERADLRIVRAPGAFISSSCSPGWEFAPISVIAIQLTSSEGLESTGDRIRAALVKHLNLAGIGEETEQELTMNIGVEQDAEEPVGAEFSLREPGGKSLWRGKIAPRNEQYDFSSEKQIENKLQTLVRLLTLRHLS